MGPAPMVIMEDETAPAAAGKTDFPVVDWLRGLAAAGVLVFHARVDWWVGWRAIHDNPGAYGWVDRAMAWLAVPTPFFGSLVMLFFVLSGFCVHQPFAGASRQVKWGAFFRRRLVRLYPPYLAAAALSLVVIPWLSPAEVPGPGKVLAVLTMTQNYTGAIGAGVAGCQPASNPSLWSLPVEMELYLVYPLLWTAVRAWGWGIVLPAVGAVSAAALVFYHGGCRFLEGNFAMYWIVWCAGAWLREQCARGGPNDVSLGVAALGCGALVSGVGLTLAGVAGVANVCWGAVYFALLWFCLKKCGRPEVDRMWARVGAVAGRWSYSLYLVHFPLLLGLAMWWWARGGAKPSNYLACLAVCAAIVPAAWLFYRAVERPSHRWARALAARKGAVR